jgi:hypothetical protein
MGPLKQTLAELRQPSARRRHRLRKERQAMRVVEQWRIITCFAFTAALIRVYILAAPRESTLATLLQQAAPGLIVVLVAYMGRYVFLERYAGRPVFARTMAPEAAAVYDSLNDIHDLDELLETALRMTIVAQYTWPKTYHHSLCSFFGGGGFLRLYLMDPSIDDLAERVAGQIHHNDTNPSDLQAKVRESIESLRAAYQQSILDYDQLLEPEAREEPEDEAPPDPYPQIEIIFVDHMINYFGLGFSWDNPRASHRRPDESLIAFLHNHFPRSLPWAPGVYFDLALAPSIGKFWELELKGMERLKPEKRRAFTSFQAALEYVSEPSNPPSAGPATA